ncbi:MAG: deoxynucleoside kinase [Candidatus Cloacimonadota bacterium]|nr:MAG: deoxynucleoside kinase [Candidatus Cloacimonadota bacterium]
MEGFKYLIVEGIIGVGKTSLAEMLAKRVSAKLILEVVEDNPFLANFYKEMDTYAFQTQIFFLLSRHKQQLELKQMELFSTNLVSDYMFEKDKIFANLTLNETELSLYNKIFEILRRDILKPSLVIYLQIDPEKALSRIKERARPFERNITLDYLKDLNEAYNQFFFHYEDCPLLIINVNEIDFIDNEEDFQTLLKEIEKEEKGMRVFLPRSSKLFK